VNKSHPARLAGQCAERGHLYDGNLLTGRAVAGEQLAHVELDEFGQLVVP
jgi:hypothetical protein